MKIVVLDAYALNPGDLTWDSLKSLGDCEIYDRTPPDLVLQRSSGAQVLLTNKTVLDAKTIAALPDLKYIGVLATGYNVVDVAQAAKSGVVVTNIPTYGTASVAQMVFAHLLNLTQHVAEHSATAKAGKWNASKDFCYWDFPLLELAGMTLGLIGFGRIGQAVARIAQAFGMRVLCYTVPAPTAADLAAAGKDIEFVDLPKVLAESDAISLHVPLTPQTSGMINRDSLAKMKPTAFLINTSRGPLVVEADLADALNQGKLAGAGLDVLSSEPPAGDNPMLRAPNCYLTPHIAWATFSARKRLLDTAVSNLSEFIQGRRQNVVN